MRNRLALVAAAATCAAVPAYAVAASQSTTLTASVKANGMSAGAAKFTGTLSGKPFGAGTVVLLSKPAGTGKLAVTFTATFPKGTIKGTSTVTVVSGDTPTYSGKLNITGGTKAFKGAKGTALKVTGSGTSPIKLKVTGKVTLPS